MTKVVATEVNIKTETELFDHFARFGVSKATYEFLLIFVIIMICLILKFIRGKTELHGNISDEVYDELDEAFQG